MARLRREAPSGTSVRDRIDDPRFEPDSRRPVDAKQGPGGRKAVRPPAGEDSGGRKAVRPSTGEGDASGVGLEAAIDAVLAADGVDPVTRVRMDEARRAIGRSGRAGDPAGFEGANLSQSLYRYVMPRLRHPEVLRSDRHQALLEGLAAGLARADEDGVVRAGTLIVRRELRRLAQLRAARNALIEG